MELKKKVKSQVDATVKYIFETEGQVVEFSYIDNNTDKDIICVPCQTMCNMSCTFCHLTDHVGKIPMRDLTGQQIYEGVKYIHHDQALGARILHISYMGCGEPLDNLESVLFSMYLVREKYGYVQFGIASIIPKARWEEVNKLINWVLDFDAKVKLHLSLHFHDDERRKEWMPSALGVKPSLDLLNLYHNMTGNPIEIHYTIMEGVNDGVNDYDDLVEVIGGKGFNGTVKFMKYSEKDSLDIDRTDDVLGERAVLTLTSKYGMKDVEFYEPPGHDIGASCGQFLMELNDKG